MLSNVENLKIQTLAHMNSGEFLDAIEVIGRYERALVHPDIEICFLAGLAYFEVRACDEAVPLLLRCLKSDPNNMDIAEKIFNLHNVFCQPEKVIELFLQNPKVFKNNQANIDHLLSALVMSGQLYNISDVFEKLGEDVSNCMSSINFLYLFHISGNSQAAYDLALQLAPHARSAQLASGVIFVVQHYMSDCSFIEVFVQLEKMLPDTVNKSWLTYQLSRSHSLPEGAAVLLRQEPSFPIEKGAFDYAALPQNKSVLHRHDPILEEVTLDESMVNVGMANFMQFVASMQERGLFQTQNERCFAHFYSVNGTCWNNSSASVIQKINRSFFLSLLSMAG